jgi:hypothetical protein
MSDTFDKIVDSRDMDDYLKDGGFGGYEDEPNTEVLDEDPEYLYSFDEETFYNDLDEVMDMINDDLDNEPGDKITIYRGNPVKVTHRDFIKNLDLIDILQEMAYEEDGEIAENYLSEVTDEDLDFVINILSGVFNKKFKQPDYHRVENIQPMTVTVEGVE